MASSPPTGGADLHFENELRKMVNSLHYTVDAAKYKDDISGLMVLNYISDSYESSREEFRAEPVKVVIRRTQLESDPKSKSEHIIERTFRAEPELYWANHDNEDTQLELAKLTRALDSKVASTFASPYRQLHSPQ